MDELNDFLYQLKRHMVSTSELRDAYEKLPVHQQEIVRNASPRNESPEDLSKHAYQWHDNLFKVVDK
ncbi:hypothetical protein [Thalassobacillus devorans]|uniref:hypothetical protein n=1 Tax=Thalassobacillus devorans TaxID=279813 RepID=UPI001F2B2A84|nr:hypothetical protein [Thalassobacillus devorans]